MADKKSLVKNPIKNALRLKGKQDINKSALAKSSKLPAKVAVKTKSTKRSPK